MVYRNAILAGAAIMLQIRGWSAVESESGSACGSVDVAWAFWPGRSLPGWCGPRERGANQRERQCEH